MRSLSKYLSLILLFLFCSIISCKREKTPNIYDFSWTINAADNVQLDFHSTAPAGSTYLWSFGDGNTSSEPGPVHAYTVDNNYYVSLVINNNTADAINKKVSSFRLPQYSFTGRNYVDYPFQFTFLPIAGINSTYAWAFGDGNTDNIANPVHTYTASGTYDISLITNNKYRGRCTNQDSTYIPKVTIYDVPLYTHLLCQPRLWRHGKLHRYANLTLDTTYSLPDSTFAVTFMDTFTVTLWGETLSHFPDQASYPNYTYYYSTVLDNFNFHAIKYNRSKDSLLLFFRSTPQLNDTTTEISYDSE